MVATSFEHGEEAGAALRSIVSDPSLGPSILDDSRVTANVLQDLLPNAPKESGLIVAAVDAGLPALLRSYRSQGLDFLTAVSLAASSFAVRTAFPPEACGWVASELANALGFPGATGPAPAPTYAPPPAYAPPFGETPLFGATLPFGTTPSAALELLEAESPAAAGLLRLAPRPAPEPTRP